MLQRHRSDTVLIDCAMSSSSAMISSQAVRRLCLLVVCCVLLCASIPQVSTAHDARFRVERVVTRDGRALSAVYSVMQDKQGYMWFGTVGGLERYDGYQFRSYPYEVFNTSGLSGYKVTAITEDSTGSIWAGTLENGLNRLDRRTIVRMQSFYNGPRSEARGLRKEDSACQCIKQLKTSIGCGSERGRSYSTIKT